jgi:hypothetical protein
MARKIRTPKLTTGEALAVVDTKTAPKVTGDQLREKIASTTYKLDGTLTICVLTMSNGFKVVGVSAAASPENFDPEVGRTLAYDNAFRQLWPLEGYLLREKLARKAARRAGRGA